MNSSKKKISRKNVVIRCRKISSTSNKSQLSFHRTPAGGYRRQIQILLKSNKSLAIMLEDARCEITHKQQLLDDSLPYLNNMMFARFKVLEMYEGFKTFIKNFDEVIPLLEVNNSKLIDLKAPSSSRDCRKWNNTMKKVAEAPEETAEVTNDKEMVESTETLVETSSNQNSSVVSTSGAHLTCNELTKGKNEREDCHDVDINDVEVEVISVDVLENTSYINNDENTAIERDNQHNSNNTVTHTSTEAPNTNHEMASELTQVPPQEACEGVAVIRTREKECVSPLIINSETPQELKTITEEPNLETNVSVKKTLPSKENISQISASDVSSSPKIQSSKIPKPKIKTNPSGILIGNATTSKRKFIKTGIKQSNASKRNTFVIKNGSHFPEFELPVVLDNSPSDKKNSADKNVVNSEDFDRPSCSRKTFVIKPPDISKNISNSPCDRRKTFVKKTCDPVKTDAAIKNKRKTLIVTELKSTLSKLNENCINQSEDCNSVEPVNIEKDGNLHINDITFEKETSCTPIHPSNLVTDSGQFHCNTENCSDVNIPKRTHSKDYDDTSSFFIAVNISEDKAERVGNGTIELQNQANVLLTDLPNNIENPLEGKNEDWVNSHTICGNASKPVSSKFFLDSFESDLSQSIPDLGVLSFKEFSPLKTPIMRRRISKSKREKVFTFDVNEIVPRETSNDYVSEKSANVCKQSTASCELNIDSVNNIKMKNQDTDNTKGAKKKKRASVVDSEQKNKATISDENLDLVCEKDLEKPLARNKKIKKKSRQKYKCVDAKKDCIASVETFPERVESKNLNDVPCTAKINSEKLTVSLDKNVLNEISCCPDENENNCNIKHQLSDDKSDTSSNDENKADKCLKSKKSKQNSNFDNAIDDIIPIPKKRKKHESKKIVDKDAFLETKAKKCWNKKVKDKKKSSHDNKDKNTFLVHAEVHPVPPSLNIPGTSSNKENEMRGLQNLQPSVVLNDIFGLENTTEKEQLLHEGISFPLKTVTSDNVQLPVDNSHDAKATVCATQDSGEVTSNRRRRHKIVNYKEPSLHRKMRH